MFLFIRSSWDCGDCLDCRISGFGRADLTGPDPCPDFVEEAAKLAAVRAPRAVPLPGPFSVLEAAADPEPAASAIP